VIARHGHFDQASRVVDHGCHERERAMLLVAGDQKRRVGLCDESGPVGPGNIVLRLAEWRSPAIEDLRHVVAGKSRIHHGLADDPGGRGSAEVRTQRLTTSASQVLGVIIGQ
jgi:hypothetical protein